jgi:lysophospholipase L1-like esterase
MIGINDISRNVPDSLIVQNILAIVQYLKMEIPKTQIIVQSLLPVNEKVNELLLEYEMNPNILIVNQALNNNAHELDYTYLDLHPYFSNDSGMLNPEFTYDGIHLNSKGYDKWVKVLKSEGLVN